MSTQTGVHIDMQILQAVDEGLDSYGCATKSIFYKQIQTYYNFAREDILRDKERFVFLLEQFFRIGSVLVERAIARSILTKFGLSPTSTNRFLVAVEIVKRHPHVGSQRATRIVSTDGAI